MKPRLLHTIIPKCALLIGFSLLCTGCAESTDDISSSTWRFAIEEAEGSVQHGYAMEFKRRIEAASKGDIKVIVYPYGTLGTSTQITEQLNLGALEFAMASPGSIGKFIPETQVFLLHFVLSDDDAINKQVLASPSIKQAFDKLYTNKGLKLLSIYPEGEMVWTTQDEIRSPGDFQGVKMRVMTSPILLDAYRAYGASPTPLPYSEVYSALQLRMVDAQVNPVFAIERQKFYEVTNWLVFPGHAHFVTTAAANRKFYEELNPDDRRLVDRTITELNDFIFDLQLDFQTTRLKKIIREKGKRRQTLNICGDLSRFVASLSAEERRELIDENEYLNITQGFTSNERRQFEKASQEVKGTYLRTGGPQAEEVLNLITDEVRKAEEADH